MKSFKQFLLEATDTKIGNYVQLDSEFPDFVDDLTISSGSKSKNAHITVVYSKESTQDKDKILKLMNKEFDDSGVAEFDRADCFGEEDTACVVLKLKSDALHQMHNRLISIGDIKHSFDEFSPHLTIFYDVNKAEAYKLAAYINKNYKSFKVKFQGFDSTTIIEDWQESELLEMPQLNTFLSKDVMHQMAISDKDIIIKNQKKIKSFDDKFQSVDIGDSFYVFDGDVNSPTSLCVYTKDNTQKRIYKFEQTSSSIKRIMLSYIKHFGVLKQDSQKTDGQMKLWVEFIKENPKLKFEAKSGKISLDLQKENIDEVKHQVWSKSNRNIYIIHAKRV